MPRSFRHSWPPSRDGIFCSKYRYRRFEHLYPMAHRTSRKPGPPGPGKMLTEVQKFLGHHSILTRRRLSDAVPEASHRRPPAHAGRHEALPHASQHPDAGALHLLTFTPPAESGPGGAAHPGVIHDLLLRCGWLASRSRSDGTLTCRLHLCKVWNGHRNQRQNGAECN